MQSPIGSIALGAGLMYWLDPQSGRQRRALVREKTWSAAHELADAVDAGSRDLANRTRGSVAQAASLFRADAADDVVITERVRSRLGYLSSHPGAIEVETRDACVILSGDVLRSDLDRLIAGAERVRGVQEVESRLRVHDEPGDVQGLQGRPRQAGRRAWTPAQRLVAAALPMIVLGACLATRSLGRA